ncbi:MAG: hypothetical protein NXH78_06560 [Hyphomonadaceae bacterium]|nr:hypothetical protein [Hyphomonadaceae bacterium]
MIRASLLTAAAAFCLAPAAMADHNYNGGYGSYHGPQPTVASVACEKQKDSDRLAGGLVGAVAGGLIGVAIGGELEPDNGYHRYRGHRGYRGYRGYRGHRHRRRGYYHDRGDDGAEIAGGVIGALAGAAIGSELAGSSTDCVRTYSTGHYDTGRAYSSQNYGSGMSGVHAPTRSPTGPAWENPQQQQSAGPAFPQPVSAPTPGPAYPDYPGDYEDDLYGAPETEAPARECTTVRRETRLPDGTVIREPVEVCQTEDGRWQMPELIPAY